MKIVQSKVRASIKDMRASPDFFTALDAKVGVLIADAIARAKGNKRKTLRAYDL